MTWIRLARKQGRKNTAKADVDVTAGDAGRASIRGCGFRHRSIAAVDAARSIARFLIISLCPKMKNAPKRGAVNNEYRNEYH
ncbi:hypothetical protein [Burkholderia sp. BCC1972]|uniref:hypothetical protein n=1 Tax=Burkholderia sp. BCC1972 TaxID=2817438 RepID=UPI002ABD53E3|nr:hypothetical protein [Burkholderia sp. BCC1972]